jgi:hypothetical protein
MTAITVALCMRPAVAAPGRAAVSIEFLPDGKCDVSAQGERVHSAMTYRPAASPQVTGEFRCAVPPIPAGTAVDVRVRLAPGARPEGPGSPPLAWSEQGGRWIGTGSLDAAPDVIVVPDYFGPGATRERWRRRLLVAGAALAIAGLAILAMRKRAIGPPSGRA